MRKKILFISLILSLIFNVSNSLAATLELFSTSLYTDGNLVAYWREENGADTKGLRNWVDVNTPTYAAGKFNNAVNFNGSNQYQITSTVFTGTAGTIHLWFNSADGGAQTLFSQAKTSDTNYFRIGGCIVTGCTDIGVDIAVAGTQVLTFGTVVNGWNDSVWHMLDFTVSSTGNLFWIDGVVTSSITYANGSAATVKWFDDLVGADNVTLGTRKYNNTFGEYFLGAVDDVAVFSRALTATEISSLYTGNFPATGVPAKVWLLQF